MKNIKHNFTKLFTLLIMAAMSMGVWADNVSIPQDFESYIVLGSATGRENFAAYISTKENCTIVENLADGSNYYTIGTIQYAETATFAINIKTTPDGAGNYEFGFKTGAASNNGSSTVDVSIQKFGEATSTTIATNEVVPQDDNWSPSTLHRFAVSGLEASTTYTITITATKTSGQYCGNFGHFYFHKFTQYPTMPTDGTTYVNLSGGTYYNSKYNDDAVVSDLDNEGYMDNIVLNNTTAGYFKLNFNVKDYKADGTLKATIYDYFTGIAETSNTVTVTSTGDKTVILESSLTAGLKRIRFDFTGAKTNGTIFNYRNVSFLSWTPDVLPVESELDLQHGTYDNAKWNNDKVISHIKATGASIDNLYVHNGSEGFYKFCFNISDIKQNSKVGITITDMATGEVEIDNQTLEITTTGDKEIRLYKALSVGLKKIRIDFSDNEPSNENEYLFNFKTVTIPAVTYDPLPLTGDAVLNLSQWPTSGNPCYESANQNLGYIYHNNTAHFYVNNTNPTAHYYLSAGIRTNVSDANLIITVTDVATGNAEINEEAFDVAEGNTSYPIQTFALSGAITSGLKLITFKFTKDEVPVESNPWLYNINNISFTLLPYTRTHKHMYLNTLCYPYQIDTYSGATFYTMLYKVMDGETVTDVYLQEHVGALKAGTPYFYVPEEGSAELVCHYSGDREETPQKVNGVQGAYADNTAVPGGAFVTYNNNLQAVAEGYVTLGEYRAYVDMNEVPEEGAVALLPGRKMLKIRNADAPAVTTDVEEVQRDNVLCTKVIENGVLYLKYNGTMYNVQGMRVK